LPGQDLSRPPAATREKSAAAIGAGLLKLIPKINVKSFVRFIKVGNTKGQRRAAFVKRSCYLFDMIGVRPLSQRQGCGRKMIEAKLVDCDTRKLPCYLETSELRNIGYYEKFGFSLIDEYTICDVNVYGLLRKPYDSIKNGKRLQGAVDARHRACRRIGHTSSAR
jgi:hypothetical protein